MSRSTVQRAAIRDVLARADGPLLPEEIWRRAQSDCASLGQATVYRALKSLEEAGEIESVKVGDRRARFELKQPHHHHFHCRACDEVFDVPGCVRTPRSLGANVPRGFAVEGHELLLRGLCASCA